MEEKNRKITTDENSNKEKKKGWRSRHRYLSPNENACSVTFCLKTAQTRLVPKISRRFFIRKPSETPYDFFCIYRKQKTKKRCPGEKGWPDLQKFYQLYLLKQTFHENEKNACTIWTLVTDQWSLLCELTLEVYTLWARTKRVNFDFRFSPKIFFLIHFSMSKPICKIHKPNMPSLCRLSYMFL